MYIYVYVCIYSYLFGTVVAGRYRIVDYLDQVIIYVYICICMYIFLFIWNCRRWALPDCGLSRPGDYIRIYMYMYIYVYVYIYILIYLELSSLGATGLWTIWAR